MRQTWRLIQSGFNDAYTNMAIDEAIFLGYCQEISPPTLRIYGWKPAAFSLGFFQDAGKTLDLDKCEREGVSVVRRMTGGGAIFHHRELTYSMVCSQDEIKAFGQVLNSFKIICSFLTNAYRKLGLNPTFAIENSPRNTHEAIRPPKSVGGRPPKQCGGRNTNKKPSSFCFASQEKYDILIDGKKIGGNAQKRRKDIIFQHGSIPLQSDIDKAVAFLKEKPQKLKNGIICLEEALGRQVAFCELENFLRDSFEQVFGVHLNKEELSFKEQELVENLKGEKYSRQEWNLNRYDDRRCQEAAMVE